MIISNLGEALRAHIGEALKDFRLPVKNGEPRPPHIVNSFLPPKRTLVSDDFPFVKVLADKGEIDDDCSTVTMAIIVGCYSQEYDGHEYCLNVLERLTRSLCSLPGGCLAGRYILQRPLKWGFFPNQPYPQWELGVETTWTFEAPQPELLEEI